MISSMDGYYSCCLMFFPLMHTKKIVVQKDCLTTLEMREFEVAKEETLDEDGQCVIGI